MFASDEERRAAWEEHREEIMEEQYTGESLPYIGHVRGPGGSTNREGPSCALGLRSPLISPTD
jgi:hypothetical protein